MFKRILWTVIILVACVAIAFGAIWLYNLQNEAKTTGNEENPVQNNTSVVTNTPAVPVVTSTPVVEPTAPPNVSVSDVENTNIPVPVVTEIPVDDTVEDENAESGVQEPVLVTPAPVPTEIVPSESTDIPVETPNTKVNLLVNKNGNIFAIVERRCNDVTKVIAVEDVSSKLQMKNGRLKNPVEAWRSEEEYVTGNVLSFEVKYDEVFTTIEEAIAKTVIGAENGFTHRLFDERKSGKLIVRIKFEYNDEKYWIEVWLQDDLFTLRKYAESGGTPPEVTQPPATTTPPPEVTQPPAETTPPPEVTQPPAETTPPPEVTQPPAETTPPPEVTQPPAEATVPPMVTQPPVETTIPPAVTQPPAVTAAPVEDVPDGITI